MATKKANPSWSTVKAKLGDFDRDDLLGLVKEIYDASKGNQALLHVRLRLDGDVLKPYKATIERWLWPDVFKNQEVSVSKAKKAIADFKKAGGTPEGLAELMVFYCEQDSGFCDDVGQDDEDHLNALARMFERALEAIVNLPPALRPGLLERLVVVGQRSNNIGYGLGDEMADLLAKHGLHD
jgi:hypothetical protein